LSNYHVYVLENSAGLLYIGHTDDPGRRVTQHNSPDGKAYLGKYTHRNGPWRLLGFETFETRSEAMRREKQLKRWKSPRKIRDLFR